jgi:AcrR family transcriptional regulator
MATLGSNCRRRYYEQSSDLVLAFPNQAGQSMAEHQVPVPPRKKPSQARAHRTVDLILEASAQILGSRGEEELTTNHIAERAGFSIGTLYQYFPNRDAILDAVIERERERSERRIRAALAHLKPGAIADTVREIVRILVDSFTSHGRMRKRFAVAITRLAVARGNQTRLDLVVDGIIEAWRRSGAGAQRRLTAGEAFVLSRAVLGALRAAVLEDSPLLKTQAFEDALVRLILGFLADAAPR